MRSNIARFLSFSIAVAVVVGLLRIVNWLPMEFQHGSLRRYDSIEKLRAALNIRDVYVPAYFPQSIAWPPAELAAQSRPFVAVLMKFNSADAGDELLVITQSAQDIFHREASVELTKITERAFQQLHGKTAFLEVGACGSIEPCSRISWREGEHSIVVVMKSAPFELIRIADSMTHIDDQPRR